MGKFYHRLANRAVKCIGIGLIVQVGHVGEQRLPLLKRIISARETDVSDSQLKQRVLRAARRCLGEHEVLVHDAGASIADMQEAGIARYVVRLALNCTARYNRLPPRKARGRPPEYGTLIRPLSRTRKDHTIPATPPELKTHFDFQGRTIRVHGWRGLVRSNQKVAASNETFTIWVFFDPLYRKSLVLGTNVVAQPETIFRLYLDRWPVEQVPLRGDSEGYWPSRVFRRITPWTGEFGKNGRSRGTYPKGLKLIDARKLSSKQLAGRKGCQTALCC
jgi:hypothetical protein